MKLFNSNKNWLLIGILIIALVLRLWRLDQVPVSMFGDELDIGYQAYSILHTGKDYTGHILPMHSRSLSEFRTPGYVYAAVPTVALFGITPWGVRLPAVLFGVLSIWSFYLLLNLLTKRSGLALLGAAILMITPWHFHYSRAGFDVTEMLFFYMIGLYCFIRSFERPRLLLWSAVTLGFTPWAYSTAKLFLPMTLVALGVIWNKEIFLLPRKILIASALLFALVAGSFAFNTLYGGGSERFGGISIFANKSIESILGEQRQVDQRYGDVLLGKIFHNKWNYYFSQLSQNYLQAYSTEFLFLKGDPIPRHSPTDTGVLYGFELFFLAFGFMFFFDQRINLRYRLFLLFWLLAAPIPSALTAGGGTQATRLILELPPLILLITYGIAIFNQLISKSKLRSLFPLSIALLFVISFLYYQHTYWVHYPFDSQRWWQSGYQQAIQSTVEQGKNYPQVIISNADEPSWIFFLAWSQFPPDQFQKNYPFAQEQLAGFGTVDRLGKYLFPPVGQGIGLYNLGKVLPENTLYLATQKEIVVDLINEPERVPNDVQLLESFANPDGSPAFYLFTKPFNTTPGITK